MIYPVGSAIHLLNNWGQISCWRSRRRGLVKSNFSTWLPVRSVTGDVGAHAWTKCLKPRPFLDLLNNEFDRAVKFSLPKRGYTHILSMNQLICCCRHAFVTNEPQRTSAGRLIVQFDTQNLSWATSYKHTKIDVRRSKTWLLKLPNNWFRKLCCRRSS